MPEPLRAAITGMGFSVPERKLTNADLEKMVETSDEWITQRTGVKERRIVSDGQTTATLATEAAKKAIADAGIKPNQLDMIICSTITPEMPCPATACFVQNSLGAGTIPAFDISAACSGFVYGVTVGSQFIETGKCKRILVIGAEVLSRITDYEDRGSCILFGDAAGAVVLEPTNEPDKGVLYNVIHTDGSGWDFIHLPGGGTRTPASAQSVDDRQHYLKMRGRDVYKFAVEKMQWLLGDCMEKCNLKAEDVDLVVPHQVNYRIMKSAAEKYDFPMEKIYINIDRFGNTSAASIPVALAEAYEAGKIKPGATVLMIAFGAGLTWGGMVVKF